MLLHLRELIVGELAGLLEDCVRHPDLADIVQASPALEPDPRGLVLRRVPHLPRDHQRVLGHALRVACCVRVARVDCVRERFESRQDDLFPVFEQAGVVDRHRRLGGELGDEVAVVWCEGMPDLVVREEEHAGRRAAQRDRDAQDRARIEWAVRYGVALHRLHERLAGGHDVSADVTPDAECQLFSRARVGAESALEDELSRLVQGEAADLRARRLGRPGKHLLEHLVQVQGGRRRLQGLLQVPQLPDASLVVVVELRVSDSDHALIAQGGEHALIVGGPLALLDVEHREGPPQAPVLQHRHAYRRIQPEVHEVRRRLQVGACAQVGHRCRPPAEHHCADDPLAVLHDELVDGRRQPEGHDRRLAPVSGGPCEQARAGRRDPHRRLERLLLEHLGALGHRGQSL